MGRGHCSRPRKIGSRRGIENSGVGYLHPDLPLPKDLGTPRQPLDLLPGHGVLSSDILLQSSVGQKKVHEVGSLSE